MQLGSSIAREADKTIYTYAGPEIAVATTKGYTSQVAILALLVLDTMRQKNILNDSFKAEIESQIDNISSLMKDTIKRYDEYLNIAKKIQNDEHLFFFFF